MPLILFILAAIFFATGGLCMKYSEGLTRWVPSLGLFACFSAGAALQALGMRHREMATSYIFVLGLEAVAAVILSFALLGERITVSKLLAIAVVLCGMVWLEKG